MGGGGGGGGGGVVGAIFRLSATVDPRTLIIWHGEIITFGVCINTPSDFIYPERWSEQRCLKNRGVCVCVWGGGGGGGGGIDLMRGQC